jgi:murein DD-endopeptidase MepM/ murein hydrolase activator NlpD
VKSPREVATSEAIPATEQPLITLMPSGQGAEQMPPTPTPDPVRETPELRTEPIYHVVQPGDALYKIAAHYETTVDAIIAVNDLATPNYLQVGTTLLIPAPNLMGPGPNFKILPDSELVYGPAVLLYDLHAGLSVSESALSQFSEDVDGQSMSGAEIAELIAVTYSVNPRLLLALLEYQGGWLTESAVPEMIQSYPLKYVTAGYEGLYEQLAWAADQLNRGYYLWRAGWEGPYLFSNGVAINPGAGVNAATVGVQYLFSQLYLPDEWRDVVGEQGFYQTFSTFFENPFSRVIEPLLPSDLSQPTFQLPFEPNRVWSYTGGPHKAWGEGSAWGALDFAPPGNALGCVLSNEWIVAVADGLVMHVGRGAVLQDLDGDGNLGTGWVVLYMHVETRDRVHEDTYLRAGDHIGHPSCEGGVASGTHVHIARRYNGEWIPADGPIPFNLEGWISAGWGHAYDGTLIRGDVTLVACACRASNNQISR